MELNGKGKRSNTLKLRRGWQRAQVFAAREELAPLLHGARNSQKNVCSAADLGLKIEG